MIPKMPRGAIPSPRSEIAASEAYRPEVGSEAEKPVPSEFPTPNYELAGARPYRSGEAVPESFLAWPKETRDWGSDSSWAEEAFAKACAEPKVFIPEDVVLAAARECGSSNFAAFMQAHGFQMGGKAYLDGPFLSVHWTDAEVLNRAIANAGPVKIGVSSANLRGHVTAGKSGWAICGVAKGQLEDYCASLCGYGQLAALVELFKRQGVDVKLPSGMPAGLCYAMYGWGSIGIIDRESLLNIVGEAWVRSPVTIVRS